MRQIDAISLVRIITDIPSAKLMDKESHNLPADHHAKAPADPPPGSNDHADPATVDLEGWVLTPAQRTFIQSLLAEEDESDNHR